MGGLIAIETSDAAVTVNTVEPLIVPEVAVMVAVPCPTLVANPLVAPEVLMVAVAAVSEDHVAVLVRFCVVPSVKVPVAANCCVVPSAMEGAAGVTAIETSAAVLTVSVVEPLTEPDVAVIIAAPWATLVARP